MQAIHKQLSDDDLIHQYIESQNQLYFSELYDRYADKIFAKCLGMLKDPTLAEDAAQEIFLKIFLKLASFNHQAKFSTWVYAVAYNYCIDLIRRNKKIQQTLSIDDENAPQIADSTEISDAEFLEMDMQQLGKALDKIPADDRAMLILKYKDRLSIKELAEMSGKTENAIKMKLKRAKDKVREHYDKILLIVLIILTGWMKK